MTPKTIYRLLAYTIVGFFTAMIIWLIVGHPNKDLLVLSIAMLINFIMASYQAYRFDVEQKPIDHRVWAVWYMQFCLLLILITHRPITALSCAFMHLPLFNSILNLSRTPEREILYTNPTDSEGSWFDRVFNKWYKYIFFIDILFFIITQILIYGKKSL